MSSPRLKNYLILLLLVTTVSSGLIAWSQGRRLAALEAELLKASASPAPVKPRPAPSEFTERATERPAETIPAEVDPAPGPPPPDAPPRPRPENNNRTNFAALMDNPEFAQAMNLQQRAALDSRYADLFKKLNLTPDQLDQFKNLLAERQRARMDVMAAARENGLNPRDNRDELRKLTEEAQAEVDANIKTTLGETVFNQYQTYEATQPQRTLVKQLDERLGYTSTTLNAQQADFLVTALAATGTTESGGGPGGGGGTRATVTDDVIQKAQSVLTPAQVTALQELQAEQQAQKKVREMMRPPATR